MKKFFLFLFVALILLILGTPALIKHGVVYALKRATGFDVFLYDVSFQFPQYLHFSQLRFYGDGKERLRIEEIVVTFKKETLLSDTIELDNITIHQPALSLRRFSDGSIDLLKLLKWEAGASPGWFKRRVKIKTVSLMGGEILLWDEKVPGNPHPIHFRDSRFSLENLLFPLQDENSFVNFHTFVGVGGTPSSSALQVNGWMNLFRKTYRLSVAAQEVPLSPWNIYLQQLVPMGFAKGTMNFEGEVEIVNRQLRGIGLMRLHDLVLNASPKTSLVREIFGITHENLIAFLQDSQGRLNVPIKVSGALDDPKFELEEAFRRNLQRNLARTLQGGVSHMFNAGSEDLVTNLEKRTKETIKEIEKTLRLDWLLLGPSSK